MSSSRDKLTELLFKNVVKIKSRRNKEGPESLTRMRKIIIKTKSRREHLVGRGIWSKGDMGVVSLS